VGTLECTSGRELLTVVDAAKLTVVYWRWAGDTRRIVARALLRAGTPSAAVPKHCWWFSARRPAAWSRSNRWFTS